MVYVGAWSPFGEPDQMPPMPDFPSLLRAHDADRSGTISPSELTASGLKVFARPDYVAEHKARHWRPRRVGLRSSR